MSSESKHNSREKVLYRLSYCFQHCSHLKRSSSACLNMETFLTYNSDVLHIRRRRVEKIMHEIKRKQKAASVVYTVIRPCISHTSFYMICVTRRIYIYTVYMKSSDAKASKCRLKFSSKNEHFYQPPVCRFINFTLMTMNRLFSLTLKWNNWT